MCGSDCDMGLARATLKTALGSGEARCAFARRWWGRALASLLAAWVLQPAMLRAASEYEVKGAFLLNFIRFTEWPREAFKDAQLQLCILGRDPFREAINPLQGKTVHGRELQIKRIATVKEVPGCHAVFVSASEEARVGSLLAALIAQPVLTVSDMEQFTERGGMITMTLVEDRVRFDVNLAAAKEQGLRVSSQVLKLARRVIDTKDKP